MTKNKPLWNKGEGAAGWVTRFTVGEDYRWDTLLLPYDLAGTRAHAWGLVQAGVLTEAEQAKIEASLDDLEAAAERGDVTVRLEDEDSHTVIEHHLTEDLGALGKKIHTGRSRNDQVLVTVRLFLRERLRRLGGQTAAVAEALCALGAAHDDLLMPGYTHLQRAMPSTAGLWALGYAELLAADLDALRSACDQVNVSPLGSAAGYGVPHLNLPRAAVAERLGFRSAQIHAPAVQLARGKIELHAVHALVQGAATINRLAADLVLFATDEFGFVALPDEYTTGSSIMPQKKNPDVAELARATYHRLLAEMNVLLTLPAGLPSGYHRDLQLTKEAVMRAVLRAGDLLTAMQRLVPGIRFRPAQMQAACTPALFATARALEEVQAGVPFRDAYRQAAAAASEGTVPDAETVLASYHVDGFPGRGRPDLVREQLARHRAWIER